MCSSGNPRVLQPKRLFIVEEIRRMRGGSQPHLMRSSTGGYYVVKFQNNPQGTRTLVNELLGTALAARLGLPTMPAAVCYVDNSLIQVSDELYMESAHGRVHCRSGLQFGSRYPLDPHRVSVWDFLTDAQLMRVKNVQDFLGMLVFDKWTCNVDGRQTIFYRTTPNAPYETALIDQGFCFNASAWDFPDAPLRGLYARRIVYRGVRGIDDFEPWIVKLEREFGEKVLAEIAQSIPLEWCGSDAESLQMLLDRLNRRRTRVEELLWSTWKASRDSFPNWNCRLAVAVSGSDWLGVNHA